MGVVVRSCAWFCLLASAAGCADRDVLVASRTAERSDALFDLPAWTAEPDVRDTLFGFSVSTAGDVNGDGYDDVIVGARDHGPYSHGQALVFHGSAQGLSDVSNWTATGTHTDANFGYSVSTAGDVNDDGFDDIIVGAPGDGVARGGRATAYFGSPSGVELTEAWAVESAVAADELGRTVSGAGDVNADGFDDVIVGAPHFDGAEENMGRAYVFHGSSGGLDAVEAWFAEGAGPWAEFGLAVSAAGDVNGDGFDDVIVGAYGLASVYYGSENGLEDAAAWTVEADHVLFTNYLGSAVSDAGDLNGDGFGDVVVGAPDFDNPENSEGRALVFLGSLAGLPAIENWTAESNQALATFADSVSAAGDVNGDGFDDLIVGAPAYGNGEEREGRAFVYYGSAAGPEPREAWTAESNQVNASFGGSVSLAGDVDADGFDDVIIGAFTFENGEPDEGRAFVFRGSCDDGMPCDGGLCRSGACDADSCYVDASWFPDGALDPGSECRRCVVSTSRTDWTSEPEGLACQGGLCRTGACDTRSCYIDGAWYAEGATNPVDECSICAPGSDRSRWTPAEGTSCAGGLCRSGICDVASCRIDSSWHADGSPNPANECETCVVQSSRDAWTPNPEGSPCSNGLCRLASCDAGNCYIDAAWHEDGALDPSSACMACTVTTSRTDWSPVPAGTTCEEDGLSCTADGCDGSGTCIHELAVGCLVDGACFADGDASPVTTCQTCRPSVSATSFVDEPDGEPCDDGLDHTHDDACLSGTCLGTETPSTDGGAPDAAAPDAGEPDAQVDGGVPSDPGDDRGGGCSCSSSPGPPPSMAWSALIVAAVGGLRRPRAHGRRRAHREYQSRAQPSAVDFMMGVGRLLEGRDGEIGRRWGAGLCFSRDFRRGRLRRPDDERGRRGEPGPDPSG